MIYVIRRTGRLWRRFGTQCTTNLPIIFSNSASDRPTSNQDSDFCGNEPGTAEAICRRTCPTRRIFIPNATVPIDPCGRSQILQFLSGSMVSPISQVRELWMIYRVPSSLERHRPKFTVIRSHLQFLYGCDRLEGSWRPSERNEVQNSRVAPLLIYNSQCRGSISYLVWHASCAAQGCES